MMAKKKKFNFMDLVIQWLCITCRDISPIISEMMDHRVSFMQILGVQIHLVICRPCQNYKIQLEVINHLTNELAKKNSPGNAKVRLSSQAKAKITKALKVENYT